MGFGSFLLDLGKNAVDAAQKKQSNIYQLKAEYSDYSDDELKRKFKFSSGDAKVAITMLLKERGY